MKKLSFAFLIYFYLEKIKLFIKCLLICDCFIPLFCFRTKKYKRPEKLEKRSEPPLSDSTDSSDIDLQIDSSSDFEFEMDRRLEENARKNNLSVMNVKSILHVSSLMFSVIDFFKIFFSFFLMDKIKNIRDEASRPFKRVYRKWHLCVTVM